MHKCRDIQAQLSLYSDGLLSPADHATVRAHVRECRECGVLLADLERIVATARMLGPIVPPGHVWLQVAGSIRLSSHRPSTPPATVRERSPLWQWAALAAALVVATFLLSLFQSQPDPPAQAPAAVPASAAAGPPEGGSIDAVNDELDLALTHYARAISELETIASAGSDEMTPEVATTVQSNLTALDDAIAESRAALTEDPASEPARDSLFEALRRKVTVLQATASLINEMRQGDSEGAAQAAENLGKKS